MPDKYYHPDHDFYRRLDVALPTAESHNVTDTWEKPLSSQLTKLMPNSWHLSGNQLTGMTEMGKLTQSIPTDYLLMGEENGLPVFKKIEL